MQRDSKDQVDLSKLELIQGGFDDRFIPSLSEKTKTQIEGSYKIVGKKALRRLSLEKTDSVVMTNQDK